VALTAQAGLALPQDDKEKNFYLETKLRTDN